MMTMHWLAQFFGFTGGGGNGAHYLFWSGAGSDLGELAIIGAVIGTWRRVNCHVKGCPRIGRVPVEGTPWKVCWRHHPEGKPDHHHILQAHQRHRDQPPAS